MILDSESAFKLFVSELEGFNFNLKLKLKHTKIVSVTVALSAL
jgi:hypothetical protein